MANMMNNHHWMFDTFGSLVIYHRLSNDGPSYFLERRDEVSLLSTALCHCWNLCGLYLHHEGWAKPMFLYAMWMLQMATVSYQTWTNTKESSRTSPHFRMIWKERTLPLINLSGIHLRQWGFWWISCAHHGIWQGGLPLRMTWLWRQTSCNRTRTHVDLCSVPASIYKSLYHINVKEWHNMAHTL